MSPNRICLSVIFSLILGISSLKDKIVDTNQTKAFNSLFEISLPGEGSKFYGQDANYIRNPPSYVDNGDFTVSDLITGLMWTSGADGTGQTRMTWAEGMASVETLNSESYLNYSDWRVPTVKELYSLIQYKGQDASTADSSNNLTAFIDRNYWTFEYGDSGWRLIDAQYIVSTEYVGKVMSGLPAFFGVNFADGRIKGYQSNDTEAQYFAYYVRNNTGGYGDNIFVADENVVSDYATGLMWMKNDTGSGKKWEDALDYCEALELDGYGDWRLPNSKELHSIVDYSRSPSTTQSAAIDPVFNITPIINELNETDYPYFWSSTTHEDSSGTGGSAVYFSFGKSLGYYNGHWQDVHGAGAQKSDPKSGDPDDYPTGNGPQGDAVRIYNAVRCVRDFNTTMGSIPSSTASPTSSPIVSSTNSSTTLSPDSSISTTAAMTTLPPDSATTLAPTTVPPDSATTLAPTTLPLDSSISTTAATTTLPPDSATTLAPTTPPPDSATTLASDSSISTTAVTQPPATTEEASAPTNSPTVQVACVTDSDCPSTLQTCWCPELMGEVQTRNLRSKFKNRRDLLFGRFDNCFCVEG